jgi:nucleoside-diphosphate-sugar epimerase
VEALAKMAGNPRTHGKTYNISGGEAVTIAELARLMMLHAGDGPKPFLHVPVALCRAAALVLGRVMRDPPLNVYTVASQINDADLDPSEAMRDLDWHPIGVRAGLARCFARPQPAESSS